MNREYHKTSFSFLFLLVVFGSSLVLASCATEQRSANNNSVENPPAVETETPVKSDDSDQNPLTVGLEGSDRTGTDPLQLLQNSQIQQELNISEEQNTQIASLEKEFRTELNNIVSGTELQDLSSEEQEQKLKQLREELKQQTDQTRAELETILEPEQLQRMRGIFLQIYGWGVLTRYDLSSDLALTPEQEQQLDEIEEDMLQKMRANWQVPPEDNPQERNKVIAQNRQKMEQIMKNSNEQSLAVLTPEQQQKLENLKGEKFELDPNSLRSPEA